MPPCAPSSSSPTYEEAENIDGGAHPRARRARARRRRPRRRRQQPRRHRRPRPAARRRARRRRRARCGPKKDGLGNAYRHGFAHRPRPRLRRVVQMDADLSHDPAALPALLAALDDGVGARRSARATCPAAQIPHWPWYRRVRCRSGATATRGCVLGMRVADATAGFRAWRADDARRPSTCSTRRRAGYLLPDRERVPACSTVGPRLVEVPITFTDRVRGDSKMDGGVVVEELGNVTWWGIRDRLGPPPPRTGANRAGSVGPGARRGADDDQDLLHDVERRTRGARRAGAPVDASPTAPSCTRASEPTRPS